MKKLVLILACALAIYHYQQPSTDALPNVQSNHTTSSAADPWQDSTPQDASYASVSFDASFDQQQIQGSGQVVRLLSDDNSGSRHQRFILELSSGQTLLVAHNIDLAPRIPDLAIGDEVAFAGEFVWNDQGGVLHWTHHDPAQRHPAGWLQVAGQRYE